MNEYTYSGQDLSKKNLAPRIPVIEYTGLFDGHENINTTSGTKTVNYYFENADDSEYTKSDKYSQTYYSNASSLNPKTIVGYTFDHRDDRQAITAVTQSNNGTYVIDDNQSAGSNYTYYYYDGHYYRQRRSGGGQSCGKRRSSQEESV